MNRYPTIKIIDLVNSGEANLQTGPFGTQLKASDYVEDGTPVINVRNVGFGDIRAENLEYLDEPMVEKLSAHLLKKGDIVFGRKGAVERHAFIGGIGEGWIQGSDCLRLRISSERINNRFVSYYFKTQSHQDWMQALCSFGATMASLNQDIVKLITLPFPPKEIQDKVAAILSSYDDLIEKNKSRIELLEKMAEEIYREWFVRFRFPGHQTAEFKKGIPNKWVVKKIVDVEGFRFIPRNLNDFDGIKNYYATSELQGINLLNPTEKITFSSKPSRAQYIPTLYSVWFARMKNTYKVLGVNSINKKLIVDAVLSSGFAGFDTEKKYFAFLYSTIKSSSFHDSIDMFSSGATQESLTNSGLQQVKILLPDDTTMIAFGDVVNPIIDEIFQLQKFNKSLSANTGLLLNRLISGKLSLEGINIKFPSTMQNDEAA